MPAPGSTDRAHPADPDELLRTGDLVIEGRMPWSSNATFLCEVHEPGRRPDGGLPADEDHDGGDGDDDGVAPIDPESEALARAIYKPHAGERPLWDFPDGLYRREVAAYELARAIRWDVVPPTVERSGPFGIGSVQQFIDADFEQHHFTLVEDEANHPQLMRMCAFDIVANSTDRKGGHVLIDGGGHLWGIDNGLCLHAEFKLRTVIWEFGGEPLPADLAEDLCAFVERPLPEALADLLDPLERDALRTRARALVAEGRFPVDHTGQRVPWPLV
ncbi:MAG: phosphatidylinositol kinase [Ilumatobacteraceae bacterium]|nr:phosphatidylinositol kinase [Ilumatobacteraceae bacterium]